MSGALKGFLTILGVALGAALAVAWIWVLTMALGDSSVGVKEAFGHLTALVVLVLFTGLIRLLGNGVGGLVLGVDGRISTSKVQVLIWTYAIAGGLLSLIASTWVGLDTGFDVVASSNFEFESYLVLLGGPFLAAVGARALVGSQVSSGETAKPPGDPQVSQVFADDKGNADLIDTQYLLFNLIAIAYFLGAFIGDPLAGLPDIPTLLYVLTGASALGYVSSKAIPSGAPKVASISPSSAKLGTAITVFGSGLLFPKNPTATAPATSLSQFHDVRVMIGGLEAAIVDGGLSSSATGGDRIKVTVPGDLAPDGDYDVVALNFRGTASSPVSLKVTG